MIRQDFHRIDPKRRSTLDHKKKQFATPTYKEQEYPYRLNFYDAPPTAEITLEQFEQWAIDRLRSENTLFGKQIVALTDTDIVLAEIEACSYRNKTPKETEEHVLPQLQKFLPLSANTSSSSGAAGPELKEQRQKDHYSHFILRLAFSATEDLRRRFVRAETMLFKFRFQKDDARERQSFIKGLNLDWEPVNEEEKNELSEYLFNATPGIRRTGEETWYKVDWERVPELVEHRSVYMQRGKAYVPGREQLSMVIAEFTARLERAMEVREPCSLVKESESTMLIGL
jgi:DNA primase large subunit